MVNSQSNTLYENLVIGLFIFFVFIFSSPVFHLFGIRGIYLLPIASIALFYFVIKDKVYIDKALIIFSAAIFLTSAITAIYWHDIRFAAYPIFFVFGVGLAYLAFNRKFVYKITTISSYLILILLVLAVISYILVSLGVKPLFSFPNYDGRPNYFFYTSISNSYNGFFVRPAGIYDEPGALSLLTCIVAALRHLTSRDKKLTWTILILGFVTTSLAHLAYFICHLIAEKISKKELKIFVMAGLIIAGIAFATGFSNTINNRILNRINITQLDKLFDTGRPKLMANGAELLAKDPKAALFGINPLCTFEILECAKIYPKSLGTPLSPLVFSGILVSWPYYFILMLLIFSIKNGRKYFVSCGIGLLFLQRPSIMSLTLAPAAMLITYLTYHKENIGQYFSSNFNNDYK